MLCSRSLRPLSRVLLLLPIRSLSFPQHPRPEQTPIPPFSSSSPLLLFLVRFHPPSSAASPTLLLSTLLLFLSSAFSSFSLTPLLLLHNSLPHITLAVALTCLAARRWFIGAWYHNTCLSTAHRVVTPYKYTRCEYHTPRSDTVAPYVISLPHTVYHHTLSPYGTGRMALREIAYERVVRLLRWESGEIA